MAALLGQETQSKSHLNPRLFLLWFRAQGLGFRVRLFFFFLGGGGGGWGLGFREQGSGFRIQVQGSESVLGAPEPINQKPSSPVGV